jgi:hypothetical protein
VGALCLNDGLKEGSRLMTGCSAEEEDSGHEKDVFGSCRFLGNGLVTWIG